MDGLERFREAQDDEHAGMEAALGELRQGHKRGHWIWYVFPQLAGLGVSETSRRFGIRGRDEAEAYLRDPILRDRLMGAVDVVVEQLCRLQPPRLEQLMGSRIDAQKLVSSLTLFEVVAADLHARERDEAHAQLAEQAGEVLAVAESQGYERCAFTLQRLAESET